MWIHEKSFTMTAFCLIEEGTAKPILLRIRRRISSLVESKSSIMTMLEQMVETRLWKAARVLVQDGHLVAGCKILANSEHLSRHDRTLMILAIAWAKEYELVGGDMVWYKERWERGTVLENERRKLVWNFEFHLRKTTMSKRPDFDPREQSKEKNMDLRHDMPLATEY